MHAKGLKKKDRFSLQYIFRLIWMVESFLHTFNIRKRVYDECVCVCECEWYG